MKAWRFLLLVFSSLFAFECHGRGALPKHTWLLLRYLLRFAAAVVAAVVAIKVTVCDVLNAAAAVVVVVTVKVPH